MDKEKEIWKDIKGYEGLYQVSDWGNVRSLDRYTDYYLNGVYKTKRLHRGKILKKQFNRYGYLIVTFNKDCTRKNHLVHRLVAEAFIPNPENKNFVGHLKTMENGLEDKTANEVWNIAWMTAKENRNYGTLNERISKAQKGRTFTEEHKKNISEALKHSEIFQKIIKSPAYSEKLSKARKGKMLNNKYRSKEVKQYTLDGMYVATYPSAKEAARQTSFSQCNISRCCNGGFTYKGKHININSAYGFKWSY